MKNYFANVRTIEQLEQRLRELQFEHHPDRNGNSEQSIKISQEINKQYEQRRKKIEYPPQKSPKRTETNGEQRNEPQPIVIVDKNRFFGAKEVETIAETGAKFGSAILRGLARGLANRYNSN